MFCLSFMLMMFSADVQMVTMATLQSLAVPVYPVNVVNLEQSLLCAIEPMDCAIVKKGWEGTGAMSVGRDLF